MGAGKIFAILAGILTLCGTYVFAIYAWDSTHVGSGIGFIMRIPDMFSNASSIATLLSIEVWFFYILVIIFIIFLAAGLLQIIFMKSRILSMIWSLFPLGVGLMFIFLAYTDLLGIKSAFFTLMFYGDYYGGFYPILVNLGDLALGAYLIVGGGALGLISGFLPRED